MNWDAWLLGARAGRAAVLAAFLAIAWVVWEFVEQGPAVSETPVQAVVTEVFDKAYALKLDNGQQARVFRPNGSDARQYKVGNRITVILATHANGEQSVTLPTELP